ncbi:MAG: S9 family peptidase [Candidatus Peribacteraceae bacterium]|nr:S9 family peptidase [Candidatus Peribacteraceae bacterium]
MNNWKDLFYWPSVYWNEVASNAIEKMLVAYNINGTYQLYSLDRFTGKSHQITHELGGKVFGCISSAGKWVIYLDDSNGNEIGHYVRVPFEGGEKENISPSLPIYSSFFIRTNSNDSVYAWTAAINETHTVYFLKETESQLEEPIPIYKCNNFIDTPVISASGRYICFDEEEYKNGATYHIWHVFDSYNQKLFQIDISGYQNLQPISFLGSNKTTVIATYKNDEYKQTVFVDILSGTVLKLTIEDMNGDITPLFYNEKKNQLLLSRGYQARQELYLYECDKGQLSKNLLSSGAFLSWFNSAHISDDNVLFLQWENAGTPSCLARIDSHSPSSNPIPVFPANHKYLDAKWEEIRFSSKSGHEIQAWMMTPKVTKGKVPFVISAHGGPHSVSMDTFSSEALMWREAGYGFLAVNYSGSTSFGEKFKSSIRGQPGTLEALDMVAARNYLIEKGLADKNKIILTGWSWGGYVTLFTVGTYPSLWAAVIAGIPVADTIASFEDETASLQSLDRELFGGSPQEVRDIYEAASPLSYVKDIQDSVLIIHAKNDSRCPARQIENFIDAMQTAGKKIESHWFESGHLGHFSNPDIAVQNYTVALDFVKRMINN